LDKPKTSFRNASFRQSIMFFNRKTAGREWGTRICTIAGIGGLARRPFGWRRVIRINRCCGSPARGGIAPINAKRAARRMRRP
jgi:hypothetical protein